MNIIYQLFLAAKAESQNGGGGGVAVLGREVESWREDWRES